MENISNEQKQQMILRDYLALERTKLANERTFFAYIRTSLYLLIGGITITQLQGFDRINYLGLIALSFSLLFLIFGTLRYLKFNKKLKKFYGNVVSEDFI